MSDKPSNTIAELGVLDDDLDDLDDATATRVREIRKRTRRHYRINPEEDKNEPPGQSLPVSRRNYQPLR